MKPTKQLPLATFKLKDRADIIKWIVNLEDESDPSKYMPKMPKYEKKSLKFDQASLYAFKRNIEGFVLSLLP